MYEVRQYVKARNVMEARRISLKREPDEIWINADWKEGKNRQFADAIGFHAEHPEEDDE
jgi:hypothetical protein